MFFGATAFAEAPFSAEGIINQSVEVTGVQAATNVDSVSIEAGGNASISTGAEVELISTVNTVEITANADVDVSTNLLTATLGNADVNYDVAIDVSTNLLQSTIDSISIVIGSDVELSTNLLQSTTNSVEIEIKFDELVTGVQLNSTVNSVEVDAISLIDVTGVSLNTTITSVSVLAGADVEVSTNLLTVSLGDEQTTADAIVNTSTNLLQSTTDSVSVQIDNEVFLTALTPLNTTTGTVVISIGVELVGLQMTSNVGKVFIDAWAVVNINATNTWTVVDIAA
jgi:hypothetical protein